MGTRAAEVFQALGRGRHSSGTTLGTLSSPTHLQVSAPVDLGFTSFGLSLPCPEETSPQEGRPRGGRGQGMASAPVAAVQTIRQLTLAASVSARAARGRRLFMARSPASAARQASPRTASPALQRAHQCQPKHAAGQSGSYRKAPWEDKHVPGHLPRRCREGQSSQGRCRHPRTTGKTRRLPGGQQEREEGVSPSQQCDANGFVGSS